MPYVEHRQPEPELPAGLLGGKDVDLEGFCRAIPKVELHCHLFGTIRPSTFSLVAAGGSLELLLAPSARDGLEGVPVAREAIVDAAARTFAAHGFEPAVARQATDAEIAASGSTWAKRLRAQRPTDRTVMLVRLVRHA